MNVLVIQSCVTLCNPMNWSLLLSTEFSRQEYWSESPFPSPGDLSNKETEPRSLALQADSLLSEPTNYNKNLTWTSLVAQMVMNLPAMWETWVQSLGQEDSLGKEMATHSNILVWGIPWAEEPGRLQFMGWQRVGHNWVTHIFTSFSLGRNRLISVEN